MLDQFEQWLFARQGEENTELVAALRQCDGEHLQAIVMVRDDFWMAATRFMRAIEIRLLEGENSAAVDLFDLDHARKVLTAFGRAFGKLPENASDTASEQSEFLKESINGLAEGGKVISVRLALYAEIMKGKPWIPASLKEVGGTKGVGVAFLEETFSAVAAPPEHRLHQKAAQAVLKALLPQSGTEIKGQMKSHAELLQASGYGNRPRDFNDLIHILDQELRLITPTDPEGSASEDQSALPSGQYYQLTHDYLVPSLRDWLTRKQRQTRRGRAEILLARAAQSWGDNPRRQSLPTFNEWLSILALTRRHKWSPLERRMLRRCGANHRARLVFVVLILAMSCVLPFFGAQYVNATILAHQYSLGLGTSEMIKEMNSVRFWIDPMLAAELGVAKKVNDLQRIRRYTAVLAPTHPEMREMLYSAMFPTTIDSESGRVSRDWVNDSFLHDLLSDYDPFYVKRLWEIVADRSRDVGHRYSAAARLGNIDSANSRWPEIASDIITDRDFATDPDLSFRHVGVYHLDIKFKEHFKHPLIQKLNQSRESRCPVALLTNLFTDKEALTLVVDGYLNGRFSLDSLKQNEKWLRDTTRLMSPKDTTPLFRRESKDPDKEKRRRLAVDWLKSAGLMSALGEPRIPK